MKKIRASTGFEPMTSANTGAMLYQLSYEATHWEQGQDMNSINIEALIFFRLLLSNCLNWKIYCDDHTSLSKKCTKNYNALAQPLFKSLNLLFGDVPVVVAIVVW